ncbi:conjugative coupling factor TraD, PFGI-1 class, partial [Vibrio sp. 10N.261.55.E12]
MSGYAEGLLRPADELLSAAMFSMAAIVVVIAPQVFMLAPVFAHPLGFCLGLCALIRLKQGLSVLGYRKRLLRMPYWAM